jgi:hypothetical protein
MGTVTRSKKGAQSAPPSPADQADSLALDLAVQTMIEGPLSKWDHTRPLGSLNRDDLRKLAIACLTGWVLQRTASGCMADTTEADLSFGAEFAK